MTAWGEGGAEAVARRVAGGVLADLAITGWEVGSVTAGTGRMERGTEREPNLLVTLRPVGARRPVLLAFLPLDVPAPHACVELAHLVVDHVLRAGLTAGMRCVTGRHTLDVRVSGERVVWACPCTPQGLRDVTGYP